MIPTFFIHHNWDMWDVLIILILLVIVFRKRIALLLLNLLLILLMFPIALISAVFGWEPKFVKRWEEEIEKVKKKNK